MTAAPVLGPPVGGRHDAAPQPARFTPVTIARLVVAGALTIGKTRLQTSGVFFYALVWLSFPLFNLLLVALIYRDDPELRNYAIVGGATMSLLFAMQFNAAEILDRERLRGTLGNLFVAPAPRYAWLVGFQLYAAIEALTTAVIGIALGRAIFGLPLDIAPGTLAVTLALLLLSMWGIAMLIGAVGVAIRDANQLSNLVFPFMQVLSGTMFPIALAPDWIRIPARCLPFGYAISALVQSLTAGASIADEADQLVPLAGFALVLPVLGIVAFRRLERRTRANGALEIV